jgi:Fe-S cluster biogenesis protein NfuA
MEIRLLAFHPGKYERKRNTVIVSGDYKITIEDLNNSLEKVRPYLKIDGGDVEIVGIKDENIIEVRLLGNCSGCALSQMTLRAGIERTLMRDFPEIKRIEAIN